MSIVVAEFTVPGDAFLIGRVLRDHGGVRIDLTQFVPVSDTLVPYFWAETTDAAAFEESVRAHDRVASLTNLDGGHERHLYYIDWAGEMDGFIAALNEHNLLVEEATGTTESWQFRVRGPDRGNLSSFQDALRERDIPVEIGRVWNPSDPGIDAYGVTPKQHEALKLAFEGGYFAVPRGTNLSELAADLGITRQSLSRRIDRGLHGLLANTILKAP